MTQPVEGWYPDPSGDASKIRYWDGTKWTEHVRENTTASAYTTSSSAYTSAPTTTPNVPGYNASGAYQTPTMVNPYMQTGAPIKDNHKMAKAGFLTAIIGMAVSVVSLLVGGMTASAFFSMLWLFSYIATIPAIIMSAIGLRSSKRGFAITGLVLGILGIIAFIVFMMIGFAYIQQNGLY
ncbi:MAG: DUF2510 domain-containing protein [Coriobacteriia bacterium]|nr:DUF2510 domain-containing protein [Coriobacteriia bacterium]